MKILFVSPYVPNRIRVRPYQLICELANRGHSVTLAAVYCDAEEKEDLQELADIGVTTVPVHLSTWRSAGNCLKGLFAERPLQANYAWHKDMANGLARLVASIDFDVVHVEHLRGSPYGIELRLRHTPVNGTREETQGSTIPIVWDSVDCISHLFAQASRRSRSLKGRLITRLELKRTQKYEAWLVHQFDRVLVTSAVDRAALIQLAREYQDLPKGLPRANSQDELARKVNVLPNGVDLDYFAFHDEVRNGAQVVFTGKMSYHANITAALYLVKDIMPFVWAQRPDTQVWIVGKDPSPEVRALATSRANGGVWATGGQGEVYVTGTTPDLRPYLRKATVAVAPITYGAGIQNKVLEAMACGAPVVASPQAVSALWAEPVRDVLVASGAQEFAKAILQLLRQPELGESIGRAGRAYVERLHSWNEVGARLENVYISASRASEYSR